MLCRWHSPTIFNAKKEEFNKKSSNILLIITASLGVLLAAVVYPAAKIAIASLIEIIERILEERGDLPEKN